MVLLNGPVQNAWFCLMDRYRNVCVWFMARNCRFPKVGTLCCQRGNHRLPLQGTAGSQRMELLVPNLGTRGYHCKQLPVPRGWNSLSPTWEPEVTIASKCRFPEVGTHVSQPGNHGLPLQATVKMIRKHFRYNFMVLLNGPVQNAFFAYWTGTGMFAFGSWQGTAGSQRLELSVANVGTTGYHCKELPVPRGWNSWFPTWEPEVTIASNCRFPRLELTLPNLGSTGYHCKELPVPRGWNSWFPTWEPWVTIASNC